MYNIIKQLGEFMSKLGRALMLPIAVLPIAGILLRLGQADVLDIPFIASAGASIFDNLPLVFAIGVAIGFAKDTNGVAALASIIAYFIMVNGLKILDAKINTGVLGGMIIGGMSGYLYNRFKDIELPSYLAFFSGKRFIPIVSGVSAILVTYVFYIVWPNIQNGISLFGNWIIESGNIGLFFYGFFNRLLIPTGLHHILNNLVWFNFGDYSVIENGVAVVKHGDLWRFYAGDKSAGIFMAGMFPVMMFGLPAACVAMILCVKAEKRNLVSGVLISAMLTSFLTGITEPIEFSFMFLAFPLYLVHAVLTGVSMVVMNVLNVKLGFTFSAGLFDYVLSYNLGNNGIYLMIVGPIYAVVYFLIFYWMIKVFDIKTMFREDESNFVNYQNSPTKKTKNEKAIAYLEALGGAKNIKNIEACATRLRIQLIDYTVVDDDKLKKLGAKGIIKAAIGLQVVIGPEADSLVDSIKNNMNM